MRFCIAIKAFFAVLAKKDIALQIGQILQSSRKNPQTSTESSTDVPEDAPVQVSSLKLSQKAGLQSEAITLLAALQREARFLDFIKEPLAGYSAEEIGAAAQNVHDQCAEVLERFFEIRPLSDRSEGSEMTVQEQNPVRCHLSGQVTETFPQTGTLVHTGWVAQKCELPQWTGSEKDAAILAPCEIEIQ